MEGRERGGGFEIPRSPRTCSFRALRALFPSHPMPSFLPAPLYLTPGALCIRISSGTSTWRSPLPSPAKWKCIKRSTRPLVPPFRLAPRSQRRIRIARKRCNELIASARLHPEKRFGCIRETFALQAYNANWIFHIPAVWSETYNSTSRHF